MDDLQHFIIIRFSTIFNNRPEFKAKEYKLFNNSRLNLRFELFENFCLKGIINQTLINFKVIIIYDEKLPEKYLYKLIELTRDYDYIILHQWDNNYQLEKNNWLVKYLDLSKKYLITTRLDDDDIINKELNKVMYDFIKKLVNKKYKLNDRVISFTGSKFIDYENNEYYIYPTKRKQLACYITHIIDFTLYNYNVYSMSHDNIDKRCKLIDFHNCFGILNHIGENDNRLIRYKNKPKEKITYSEILNKFL